MASGIQRREVPVAAGTLAVRDLGDGPPVLLLHGIPGAASVWSDVAIALAGAHRVLVPDLLGFGQSSRPAGIDALWAGAQAAALAEALEALETGPVAVAGHDFGGPVALALVGARPDLVSHLALCATNAFGDTPIPMPIRAVTWPALGGPAAGALFSRPSLRMTVRRAVGVPKVPVDARGWVGDRAQARAIRTIFATALRELEERYAPVEATLRSLTVPALVAWGDQDPFFAVSQAHRTAEAIGPDARLRVYEGCGHFVPAERPADLSEDLAALVGTTEKAEKAEKAETTEKAE